MRIFWIMIFFNFSICIELLSASKQLIDQRENYLFGLSPSMDNKRSQKKAFHTHRSSNFAHTNPRRPTLASRGGFRGDIDQGGNTSPQRRTSGNPQVSAADTFFQAVVPVIASLKVPDITPAIDLIKTGYNLIYTRIDDLIQSALTNVKETVVMYTSGGASGLESIITNGNASLRATIVAEFDAIVAGVVQDVNDITTKENSDTSFLFADSNEKLIEQIKQRLATVDDALEEEVTKGLGAVIMEVTTAITNANNDVYTQITNLLADPNNTKAIIPQLVFIDPKTISEYLTSDSNEIYLVIERLLKGAFVDIEEYVRVTSSSVVDGEADLLNVANNAIVTAINLRINDALVVIKKIIDTATEKDSAEATNLINNNVDGLSDNVEQILLNLMPLVIEIVNSETKVMVDSLSQMIATNNQSITNQVDVILDSS